MQQPGGNTLFIPTSGTPSAPSPSTGPNPAQSCLSVGRRIVQRGVGRSRGLRSGDRGRGRAWGSHRSPSPSHRRGNPRGGTPNRGGLLSSDGGRRRAIRSRPFRALGNDLDRLPNQRRLEHTRRLRPSPPIPIQQPPRLPRQFSPDLPAPSLYALDVHVIVGRRLVPQPRDHRRLRSTFDRDPGRSRDRAAPYRRRMRGDSLRELSLQVRMVLMEVQEPTHVELKLHRVLLLRLVPAPTAGRELLFVLRRPTLPFERPPSFFDRRPRRPKPLGEQPPASLLLHGPSRTCALHPPREARIARGQQFPTRGHDQYLALVRLHRPWTRTGPTDQTALRGVSRHDREATPTSPAA